MVDGDGTARRDAALTLVVLVAVAGAAVAFEAAITPAALALGAGATLVAELLLSLRTAWVRAVWADRRVQAVAVVVAIAGGVSLALAIGPWVLTVLVAALVTYLVILVGSVVWRAND